ncbi:MAG: hypothetical protein AB7F99_11850, partial [Vicinamibacterales bacterium]
DAEALCSRVAVLAKGRLAAAGRLTDIVAFEPRGWDLVVAGVDGALAASLEGRARRFTRIGDERFSVELPLDVSPDRLLAEIAAHGGTVVSLNPIRETLEDFFVRQVTSPGAVDDERGLRADRPSERAS